MCGMMHPPPDPQYAIRVCYSSSSIGAHHGVYGALTLLGSTLLCLFAALPPFNTWFKACE